MKEKKKATHGPENKFAQNPAIIWLVEQKDPRSRGWAEDYRHCNGYLRIIYAARIGAAA